MTKPFDQMTFDELLRPQGHDCACGMHHDCGLKYLRVGKGVVSLLPQALQAIGARCPFLVMDPNTRRAAGETVERVLREAGIDFQTFVFRQSERIEPDEAAVGAITMAYDPACDVILAVGSGVINDCCKVVAHASHVPSAVVCTAPSMDGYASNSSAMLQNRVKVSPNNACAQAILADTDLMATAPDVMLRAGLGDMLAKYVSLCEWRISHLVYGDAYCPQIAQLVRASVRKVATNAPGLLRRDEAAIAAVAEGLILSGVAMAFAGNSRPASGLEHYFSHVWEMFALQRGGTCDLHGIQVGVGVRLTLWLYDKVLMPIQRVDAAHALASVADFSEQAWRERVERVFGPAAPELIALEARVHKNDPQRHRERLSRIVRHWDEIRAAMREELPAREEIDRLMRACGMPMTPADLGVSLQDTLDALVGSRDLRDKYLTSSLLWDLGLLDDAEDSLREMLQNR